jgi:ubiquinone/menaquinone biosynthesis C-methylase UbiE
LTKYLHGSEPSEQLRLEALAKLLGGVSFLPSLKPGMRLLDVGCGTGVISREAASHIFPGEVIGIDCLQRQIETARRFAAQSQIRTCQYKVGDAEKLPFGDNEFDGVYCRFLLEHVVEPKRVVSEMVRVAKPGAWVCACEWEAGCSVSYPGSEAIAEIRRNIYSLQRRMGGDPGVARELYSALGHVRVEGRAWTISGEEKDRMRLYVEGAQEIIRQTLSHDLVAKEMLDRAELDYSRVLEDSAAFVLHAFCCAPGMKP